ncbi:hypothetical protein GWI33_011448, partial [Rhynchophorus ferrugineus]
SVPEADDCQHLNPQLRTYCTKRIIKERMQRTKGAAEGAHWSAGPLRPALWGRPGKRLKLTDQLKDKLGR